MSRRVAAFAAVLALAACGQNTTVTGADAGVDDVAVDDVQDAAVVDTASDDATPTGDTVSSVGLWTAIPLPGDPNVSLHGVWSDGSTRVVAAGTNGTVVTWDGLGWKVVTSGKFATLNAVAGSPNAGMAFAVGMGGTVVQSAGVDGSVGKVWAPPGGCLAPSDCDDADVCTTDVCDSGVCQHGISGAPGCCGGVVFADSFDSGLGKWTVTDNYANSTYAGGIVWKSAGVYGTDGVLRASSPPSAAYFGRTDVPCVDDASKSCATFDNGKTVGSVMTSQEFTVPNGKTATLNFQLFLDVQSGFYDTVQISVLAADGSSSNLVADKQTLWPSGSTNGVFAPQSVDLSPYLGQKIKLSIRFESYSSSENAGQGVFIDDLLVSTTCASGTQAGKGLTSHTLFGAWAFADNDAYAVGDGGVIAHWDGTAWGLQTGANTGELDGMAGAPGVGILAVGDLGVVGTVTSTGVSPTPVPTDSHLYAIGVDPISGGGFNACAVGAGGITLDGNSTTGWKLGTSAGVDLTGVTSNGSGGWVAVSPTGGAIYERVKGATKWTSVDSIGIPFHAVTHTASGQVIAVGDSGMISVRTPPGTGWNLSIGQINTNFHGVSAVSDTDIWAVGDTGIAGHFLGSGWASVQTTTTQSLRAVWAASATAVYAVGMAGAITRWDGKAWKKMTAPPVNGKASTTNWYAVWGNDENDVYAMGDAGQIAHFDGTDGLKWHSVGTQINGSMRTVWGLAANDVWAAGELGLIYHNDGSGWVQTPIPDYQPDEKAKPYKITTTLLAIWGTATDDVWAVGEPDSKGKGVLVHWDGSTWNYDPSFKDEGRTVRAMWGWSKDKILMAGTQGMVLRFDGQGNYQELHPGTIATLFGITGYGKDALLVGDIGTVLRWTPLD